MISLSLDLEFLCFIWAFPDWLGRFCLLSCETEACLGHTCHDLQISQVVAQWVPTHLPDSNQALICSHQYPTMMTMNQSVLLTSLCLFNYLAQRLAGCWSFGSLVSWVTASLRTTTQNPAGNCSFMRTLKHRLQSDLVTWTTSGYTQGKPNHKQPSKIIHKLGKL